MQVVPSGIHEAARSAQAQAPSALTARQPGEAARRNTCEGLAREGGHEEGLTGAALTGGNSYRQHDACEGGVCEAEGTRIGRYVLIRDQEGCLHALSSSAVAGIRESDDGSLLLLTGGRMLQLSHPMLRVLRWFAL